MKELYDEPISDEMVTDLVTMPADQYDVVAVRRLLIRIGQAEQKREQTAAILKSVTATYQEEMERHEREVKTLRERVEGYVRTHGNVSLPDVGTAYLATEKAKVAVVDPTAAKKYAEANGYVKPTADVTACKNAIQEAGELPPEGSGLEWMPETEGLRIRWK